MSKAFQFYKYPLPALTWAASTGLALDPNLIPSKVNGRPAHVAAIDFIVRAATTLSSGTATMEELQLLFSKIRIADGVRTHFDDKMSVFRLMEAYERGQLSAEPDAGATTEQVIFKRRWRPGPPNFAGSPTDFLLPPGAFKGGAIELSCGALVDPDANATAETCTVQAVVHLAVLDEVRFGPTYERRGYTASNEANFGPHQSLIAFLAMLDAATPAAITAGDFANISAQGTGNNEKAIHASDLAQMYIDDMGLGAITQVRGEPRSATDDNQKIITGTAAAAATALIQPVIWSPPDMRITKIQHVSDGGMNLKWDGTQAACYALVGRFVERSADELAKYMDLAGQALGRSVNPDRVKTLSKKDYKGRRHGFLPLVASL